MAKSNVSLCNDMTVEHDGWAELNSDLLDEIIKHIDFYGSYVRVRAVCRRWHYELPKDPKYIKKLWLVLPFDDEKEIFRPFLDIAQNKHYYLELPETRNTIFRGSYYDWLIIITIDGTLCMLNPFTRIQVDLPPFSAFPDLIDVQPVNSETCIVTTPSGQSYVEDRIHLQKLQVHKLIMSSQPENAQDFMALAIYGGRCQLCYCRLGDKRWTAFQDFGTIVLDAIFHEGKIYVVNGRAELYEFRFDTCTGRVSGGIVAVEPPIRIGYIHRHSVYVVGTPLGLLLVNRQLDVKYNKEEDGYCYTTCGFIAYKLSRNGDKITWSEVNNLGEYALLLGYNTSTCMLPPVLSNLKGNRIYYTDNKYELQFQQFFGGQDIGVYDLEDRSLNKLFLNVQRLDPAPVWLHD